MKKHIYFGIFFASAVVLFCWPLATLKKAFIGSDYFSQFYPWFKVYAESVKHLQFPFWVRAMGCGFPLVAEGQIGAFYPLHILLFYTLPFKLAYNYDALLHFFLAGFSTYLYSRKLNAGAWGGALAAILFVFGSAYGGLVINLASLKVFSLFPLVLCCLHTFLFEGRHIKWIVYAGFLAGLQHLAGAFQFSAYSILFYCLYLCVGYGLRRRKDIKNLFVSLFVLNTVAILVSLPQLLLSFQLMQYSGRAVRTVEFALWNSFSPLEIGGIVFPYAVSAFGTVVYITVIALFFIFVFFTNPVQKNHVSLLVCMFFFFILSLGKFNPLYVLLLKATSFYTFRSPSKFVLFFIFGICCLAAVGFRYAFESTAAVLKRPVRLFSVFLSISVALFAVSKITLTVFGARILDMAKSYAADRIYGKPHHQYSLQEYMQKTESVYQLIKEKMSLASPFVISSFLFLALALIIAVWFVRFRKRPWARPFLIGFVLIELLIYSAYGTGFRGNMKTWEDQTAATVQVLTEMLEKDDSIFRIYPYKVRQLPEFLRPNSNILYGWDSIAVYTPLVSREYLSALGPLGAVDDSLGFAYPHPDALIKSEKLLKALNIKYIISPEQLTIPYAQERIQQGGIFLYQLNESYPRAFLCDSIDSVDALKPRGGISVVTYKPGFIELEADNHADGYVVFSECYYPGWEAFVDGHRRPIRRAFSILQAVYLSRGRHRIIFVFKPDFRL